MTSIKSVRGFTLMETVIATGLLVTALAGLAQLLFMSVRFTVDAGQFGVALVAAQDKLETLRALRYGYDALGAPQTDPRLAPSPGDTLSADVDGFVDWLDVQGEEAGHAAGAEYVRRWRITEVEAADPAAIVIDVCVFTARSAGHPRQAEACLATARVRQP